ncbi:neural proliferation differentiation and control protein 1-like [Amphibalanus amphitrite]|uniref:neural proliferation differentiation and control protein 1-like n=1 Tax=Amphibalanus amphitrite TaxID=1232801 RepID=UPI001C904FD7|nr:neural proliferation differentiation and control protein 1-like [Amphibalanus amphitrite]
MALPRPPPALLISAVIAVIAAAATAGDATSSDVQLLQAIQSEDGAIDRLIRDVLKLQEAKELSELSRLRAPLLAPSPVTRGRGPDLERTDHPVRQFADYPSDPEYSQPRQHTAAATDKRRGEQPTVGGQHKSTGQLEIASPIPSSSDFYSSLGKPNPDSVSDTLATGDVKDKRPMAEAHLAGRPAALRGSHSEPDKNADVYFIVAVVGICTGTVCVSVLGGICYRYLQRRRRHSSTESGPPSYGVTGPHSGLSPASADRRLAQSAQLYHYQHQKQHMMAIQEGKALGRCSSPSDENSDPEDDESEHTVYECPGLAPSGEMEVKNPLFSEDPTPCQSMEVNEDL